MSARERKKLPEQELKELKSLLDSVKLSILDNNQNTKDALKLINDLKKNLGIEDIKPTLFQRIRKLLVNK